MKRHYLSVKNLERYQHYKDRDPKWIKLYYSILDDEVFMVLDETLRCRYMTCLLIASRTGNKIPYDAVYLKKVMRLDRPPDLTRLISLGFLMVYESSSIGLDDDKHLSQGTNDSLLSSPLLNPLNSSESDPDPKSTKQTKTKGKTTVPLDWKLSDEERAGWAKFGLNPSVELAAFKDHALTEDRRCSDWRAAFRNWCRKSIAKKETRP